MSKRYKTDGWTFSSEHEELACKRAADGLLNAINDYPDTVEVDRIMGDLEDLIRDMVTDDLVKLATFLSDRFPRRPSVQMAALLFAIGNYSSRLELGVAILMRANAKLLAVVDPSTMTVTPISASPERMLRTVQIAHEEAHHATRAMMAERAEKGDAGGPIIAPVINSTTRGSA